MLKTKFIIYKPLGSLPSKSVEDTINDILQNNEFVSIAVGGDANLAYITLVYKTESLIIPPPNAAISKKNQSVDKSKKRKDKQRINNNNKI